MESIAVKVLEWALQWAISSLGQDAGNKAIAWVLRTIDGAVQAADARVTGPFKGLADEAAAQFDSSVQAICKALGQ